MAQNAKASAFQQALAQFKDGLKPRDKRNFTMTTLEDLKREIGQIQAAQNSKRRLQNLNRLRPFLEAMDQFGKVIEVFAQSSEFVAFVWVRPPISSA